MLLALLAGRGMADRPMLLPGGLNLDSGLLFLICICSCLTWLEISLEAFWYSSSYRFISSLEIRNLEKSPSRPLAEEPPFPAALGILERFGMLEADDSSAAVSSVTPASTRNSLAEGSRFSRLVE